MARRTRFIVFFLTILLGFASRPMMAQSGRTFYISYASGSDSNNGTTEGSPWKTHPYMMCSGVSGYTHQAGDRFIFKGGDSWPSSCFQMTVKAGGTSSAKDYYGVCLSTDSDSPCSGGTSWPASGWTRPKFAADGQSLVSQSTNVIRSSGASYSDFQTPTLGYVTIDNIEIGPWGYYVLSTSNNANGPAITFGGAVSTYAATGVIVENMYIHDWFTTTNLSSSVTPAYGVVYGVALLENSTISDANGYWYSGGSQVGGASMGGCAGCTEVKGNTIHDGWIGCSSVYSCHDNEIYNIQGGLSLGIHTHMIYEDGAGQTAYYAYNNYLHDSQPGLVIQLFYHSYIFNNVISNIPQNAIYLDQCEPGMGTSPCGDSSSAVGYVANNTIDMSGTSAGGCYQWYGSAGLGTMIAENNICITGSGGVGGFRAATLNSNDNYTMSPSEASNYGFTQAQKYSPTGADPNVSGGANLSNSCSGSLGALCLDASGAPWFGGTSQARPGGSTPWSLGAFVFGATTSSSSKPNAPSNLTAIVD